MERINTYYDKRSILSRMLDLAADIQGISKSEPQDPVVTLLVESLAEEIYHLSTEIDNLEARVLNKLSSILVSETQTLARPAHSLMHVSAREGKVELTTGSRFFLTHNYEKKSRSLSLYPVCNTTVYSGDIRYFIFDRYLFSIDQELTKTLINRNGRAGDTQEKSFWIGLELDGEITDITGLSFYMNLSHGYGSRDNLNRLFHSQWRFQGQNIRTRKGLFSKEEMIRSPEMKLFHRFDNAYRINREIKKSFDRHYITIDQPLDLSGEKEKFPTFLASYFPQEISANIPKELYWFEIICPSDFTDEMMRAIEISINIIPVSCKELVEEVLQLDKRIPIIPINTRDKELFLSVDSLSDSTGVFYYDIPLPGREEESYGIYSLRDGGYERFNSSDSKEFLTNMTHLIEGEAASLLKKNDEPQSEQAALWANVDNMIRSLKKTVNSDEVNTEVKKYLLVEQQRENEVYFLKYWTADSSVDIAVKENTVVRPSAEQPVSPAGIRLIQSLSGGKRPSSQYDKSRLQKKSLTEHPLLITGDDIKRFCLKEFGEMIEQVEIKPGYRKSSTSGSGFIKTTNVYLHPARLQHNITDENINRHIEQILQEHSPATFNYNVILK